MEVYSRLISFADPNQETIMLVQVGSTRKAREHPVACAECGYRQQGGKLIPVTITWNYSGLCDTHEGDQFFKKVEEARNDFE